MSLDPQENPLYARADQIHPLHWQALAQRPPGEVAAAAGADWDGQRFRLRLLGDELLVDPGQGRLQRASQPEQPLGYQRGLVALTYLAGALEVPVAGRWVALRELPGGGAFFRGPHSVATPRLAATFGDAAVSLVPAAAALDGRRAEGADVAVELPALPRIPLRVLLWGADAEFPASAQLLTDARAHLHLPLDGLWALSNLVIADLVRNAPCAV